MSYNAIAIAFLGDQRAIGKARRTHESWEKTYEALLESGNAAALHGKLLPPGEKARSCALPDPVRADEELKRAGVGIILDVDPRFPPWLREIPHPPHAIYVQGDAAALGAHAIAIVGTRRATRAGKDLAHRFGRALATAGFSIASGLAFGIDAAAHEGCLEAGHGRAIAVLAGGLGAIHPQNHEGLARKIIGAGGVLISEYPLHEPPLARRFIERNRLVSGLTRGTVVIEAPERSGALATARFALEQNRDVFVLPGNIAEMNYRGSNRLIRQGAELVTSPQDIFETYGMVIKKNRTDAAPHGTFTHEESLILEAIACAERGGMPPPDVDKISVMTKLEPRIVNRALTFLIIKEAVREHADGFTANHEYQ